MTANHVLRTVLIPADVFGKIAFSAKERGVSLNSCIVEAIKEYTAQQESLRILRNVEFSGIFQNALWNS